MSTQTLRSIAAEAIRSSQSNTATPDKPTGSAEKDVTISNLSFKVDQETVREIEEKRSKIRDVLGVGTEATTSDDSTRQ
jgi:hypothetical protein